VGVSIGINVADNLTAAEVESDAALTGGSDVTLSATGSHETTTTAESGGKAADGTGVGGSFAITVADNVTQAQLGSGAGLDITGTFSATATHHGSSTTTADSEATGGTAVGASIALAFVDDHALATNARDITADGAVSFVAQTDGASTALSKAGAEGADTADESGSGNAKADDQKQKQIDLANSKSGKADATPAAASADDGSGGDVSVAAALAVNVATSEAIASTGDVTITAGDGAGTGALTLTSSNNMDAQAIADGSAAGGSEGTSVGVAVAINVANMTNQALVSDGATVTADGLTVSATIKDVDGDTKHVFAAKSTSGASGGDTGVAGSFALSIGTTVTEAALQSDLTASTVDVGTGAVSLTAASTTESTVEAKASAESGSTGVGVSIGINVVDNLTAAEVDSGAALTGGSNVTLSASGSHETTTTAESGGKAADGTGVGGAFAITVADNVTQAQLGSGGDLDITGAFSATATHHGASTTTADSEAGGGTAVGASIALAFVDDSGEAILGRNTTAGGNVSLSADVDGSSKVQAIASAEGADSDDETAAGNSTADDQKQKQIDLANAKSGKTNTGDKSANATDGSSGGDVSVAAALALNVSTAVAEASIEDGVSVTAGDAGAGSVSVATTNNIGSEALADGSAKTTSDGTGVGVAVAINVATMVNDAVIGTGTTIDADGVTITAGMKTVDSETTRDFKAEATSGASGGDIGVAGSFALSLGDTTTRAVFGLDRADQRWRWDRLCAQHRPDRNGCVGCTRFLGCGQYHGDGKIGFRRHGRVHRKRQGSIPERFGFGHRNQEPD
jgi:hypothetical protein